MSMHGPALREALDGPHHELKQRLRQELPPDMVVRPYDQSMDQARQWVLESLKELSGTGFSKIGLPEGIGDGQPMATSIAAFEILAMGDLSLTVKSGVQQGLFGGAILNLGNEEQIQKWMPGIIDTTTTGCYGMTELGRGSDVQSLGTTITYVPDDDEFEINTPTPEDRKAYIGNAAEHGELAAVFGQLIVEGENHGVHCIVVPVRDDAGEALPGVTLGDHGLKGGLLGVDNGTMAFDHVRVPRTNLLNRYGTVDDDGQYHSPIEHRGKRFYTTLSTLVRGRISVGGAAASATRRALTIATRYGLSRTQFATSTGEPVTILEYQAHQKKLMPEIAYAYAMGFAQNRVIEHFQQVRDGADEKTTRELEARAAGLKAVQTRWANDTIQVCREACGGAGYMTENGLTTLRGDADVFATFEGDNTVLFQLVGRSLLAEFQSSWKDLDMLEAARRSAALVGNRLLERTTATATIDRLIATAQRKKGDEILLARGWQVEMLEFREKRIVESLGMRMRDVLKLPKEEQFAGFNSCQNHLIAAAKAHMDRVILEAFIGGIGDTAEGPARDLLIKLCDLYALSVLRRHRSWFLEHGQIDGTRSRALTTTVERLCAELATNADDLVDGLGVPEEWLNSAFVQDPNYASR
ncbi:acyl-CoA dehydrogenase family protein [Corynebacterium pilosum]|uniref:acyl-CoA oxidase n=2 Tax=Corynebacterium pilosum TaxID=35756 RepID=A0A376CLC1_9CORY|nr:acyl-CoA dehydrogenase [Corynebacterium pilosum]STC69286.1 acyl-CoA oxidase [Corynebacterium pilosum]